MTTPTVTERKVKQHKGFIIAEVSGHELGYNYTVYTSEEWSFGKYYRTPEWEADNLQECIDFIDSY